MKTFAESLIERTEGKELETAYDCFNRGNAYAELGRHVEAIADYDRANELEPDYETGMAWFNRGNSLTAIGDDDEAVNAYEHAVSAGTREWAPFVNAALTCVRQERFDQAIAFYDRYLALEIDLQEWGCANADALIRKAEVLYRMGDESAAVTHVADAVALEENAVTLGIAADFHSITRGAWADAVPLLERAYALDPQPIPGVKLGIALANVGRQDDALAHLRALIATDPELGDMIKTDGWRSALLNPDILDRL